MPVETKKPKVYHFVKVTIEYIAEAEDLNVYEVLETLRGTGSAKVVNVEAVNTEKQLYEFDQ